MVSLGFKMGLRRTLASLRSGFGSLGFRTSGGWEFAFLNLQPGTLKYPETLNPKPQHCTREASISSSTRMRLPVGRMRASFLVG